MAIPFSLPSDEPTLKQYRIIHQLLVDLTALLRTVLARNPAWVSGQADVAVTTNANYPVSNSTASTLDSNNTNSESASTIGFYPTGGSPPFQLPLSPPNSEPASPSAFVSTTATSNSQLPDVVCSAARTLNDLRLQQTQPVACDSNASAFVVAHTSSNGNWESRVIHTNRRLRKRKRIKLPNEKVLQNKNDELNNSQAYEGRRQQQQQRPKVAKFNYKSTTGAICLMANATGLGQQKQQQPRDAEQRSGVRAEREKLACSISNCEDRIDDDAMRLLANECFCNCKQQLPSQSDYNIPVCMQVGEELRKISEYCQHWRKMNGCNSFVQILSAEFGKTVFATALLIIGWTLLRQM